MKLFLVRLSPADNPQIDRWVKVFSDGSPIAEIFESTVLDRAVRAPWTGDPFIIAGTPKDLDLWLNSLDGPTVRLARDCAYWWVLTSSSGYVPQLVSQDRLLVLNWHDNQQNIIHEALELLGRFPDLVGLSRHLHVLREDILRIGEGKGKTGPSTSVAILGGSGSGKELVAHALFKASDRPSSDSELLCLGGAWLNMEPGLALSELLGIEPGIASGVEGRPGLVELYSNGALMFDDFESAPRNIQEVLLRIMATPRGQRAKFRRTGGTTERETNVWLIFATNSDVRELIKDRRLRIDFIYRLEDRILNIPSLSMRPSDIPAIARHLWHSLLDTPNGRPDAWLLGWDALRLLVQEEFLWGGNVRELQALLSLVISRKRMALYRDYPVSDILEQITSRGRSYLDWFVGTMQTTHEHPPIIHVSEAIRRVQRLDEGHRSERGLTPCEIEVQSFVSIRWKELEKVAADLAGKKRALHGKILHRLCRYVLYARDNSVISSAEAIILGDIVKTIADKDLKALKSAGFLEECSPDPDGKGNKTSGYALARPNGSTGDEHDSKGI